MSIAIINVYCIFHKPLSSDARANFTPEQQAVLRRMLDQNEDVYTAWSLKEWFIQVKNINKYSYAERELRTWLQAARESNLPEFDPCISALHNWFRYIVNSFRHKYTNGFTEGMNNNIKVLKRIAYGYRNFNNLRNRVMLCFGWFHKKAGILTTWKIYFWKPHPNIWQRTYFCYILPGFLTA